jgi:uncharacterized protein YwgA
LAILNARDHEPIKHKILFQKIAFLSLRNFEKLFQLADFKAHKFGPYSPSLNITSEELALTNKIIIDKEVGYQININGTLKLLHVFSNLLDLEDLKKYKKLEEVVNNVKEDFNDFTVNQMLAFIYKSFPEYIEPSIKAEELNYEALFLEMYEEGKIGISKIAELMNWSFDKAYEFIKKNARAILLK